MKEVIEIALSKDKVKDAIDLIVRKPESAAVH